MSHETPSGYQKFVESRIAAEREATAPETHFTPGPYRWDHRQGGVVDPTGERVMMVGISLPGGNHPKAEEAEANARLYIAAPLMYATLDDMLAFLIAVQHGQDVSGIVEGNIRLVLHARAVARGETPEEEIARPVLFGPEGGPS